MSIYKRSEVSKAFEENKIVPLFCEKSIDKSIKIIIACVKAGYNVIEFTNRLDMVYDVFKESMLFIRHNYPGIIFGVGSIIDSETAALYIAAGADFIVGPSFNKGVAKLCNSRKILYIPAASTVSEIQKAHVYGAELIKIFPAKSLGGPDFIKSLLGPIPFGSFMATGGVTTDEEDLRKWFKSGVTCVGLGSNLLKEELIENDEFDKLTKFMEDVRTKALKT